MKQGLKSLLRGETRGRFLPVLFVAALSLFLLWEARAMARLRSENAVYRQLFEAQARGTLDIPQTQRVLDDLKKVDNGFDSGVIVIVSGKR